MEREIDAEGEEGFTRIRMPRHDEIFGIVEQRMGFGKMSVRCQDEHVRLCRVKTKGRKKLWIAEGNVVLVKPWELKGDVKGDIVYKYSKAQVGWLRRKNILIIE